MKVNFGCGNNRLDGWQNFDVELDITNVLPFGDNAIDFILAEHVVEHTRYREAVLFLTECIRVLRPGGVARIIVPSVERIMIHASDEYLKFIARWARIPDVRGAMGAILWEHGHKTPWTESLLMATMYYAGFDDLKVEEPRQSSHKELEDVDGHWKVIGEHDNWVESSIIEGTKTRRVK